MKGDLRHVERLVTLGVAVLLLPLALYGGWLAWQAYGEAEKFRGAPEIGKERLNGVFYKVDGPVTSPLLNPTEYPEVKDALMFRVTKEKKVDGGGWLAVEGTGDVRRMDEVAIGDVPVVVSEHAHVFIDVTHATRETGDERLSFDIRTIPPGTELVAYGEYEHGKLIEGAYDRLLLTTKAGEAAALDAIARTAKLKAWILLGLTVGVTALGTFAIRAALREPRPRGAPRE